VDWVFGVATEEVPVALLVPPGAVSPFGIAIETLPLVLPVPLGLTCRVWKLSSGLLGAVGTLPVFPLLGVASCGRSAVLGAEASLGWEIFMTDPQDQKWTTDMRILSRR
jgi:hypothetical protein